MYKKAPEGMVAQQFTTADAAMVPGTLACLTGDLAVSSTGGTIIGEVVARDTHVTPNKVTVELKGSKILDVIAGVDGVTFGQRAKMGAAANTVIHDDAGELLVLSGGTAGNPAIVMFA